MHMHLHMHMHMHMCISPGDLCMHLRWQGAAIDASAVELRGLDVEKARGWLRGCSEGAVAQRL